MGKVKCEKLSYGSEKKVLRALKRVSKIFNNGKAKNYYKCDKCGKYHITSLSRMISKHLESKKEESKSEKEAGAIIRAMKVAGPVKEQPKSKLINI